MKRSSFFKSLATLIAAPSVLAKIQIKDSPVKPSIVDKSLFKDLQLLTPSYYKESVEKYGNEDFTWWLSEASKKPMSSTEFHHFENGRIEMSGHPISAIISLTKNTLA
jgi:hypothetical protein